MFTSDSKIEKKTRNQPLTAFEIETGPLGFKKWPKRPKMAKNGQKWPKMAKNGQKWPKMAQNGPKWPKMEKL